MWAVRLNGKDAANVEGLKYNVDFETANFHRDVRVRYSGFCL